MENSLLEVSCNPTIEIWCLRIGIVNFCASIGSAHKAEHNIYIWDKNMGNLVKILEGPKEPLDDLTVWPQFPSCLETLI